MNAKLKLQYLDYPFPQIASEYPYSRFAVISLSQLHAVSCGFVSSKTTKLGILLDGAQGIHQGHVQML